MAQLNNAGNSVPVRTPICEIGRQGSTPVHLPKVSFVRLMVGPCSYKAETEVQFLHEAPKLSLVQTWARACVAMDQEQTHDVWYDMRETGLIVLPISRTRCWLMRYRQS